MGEDADRLDEAMLDLAWSLWSALGVSSWETRSVPYVIEVEPLLAFTAFVVEGDPRLRREVVAWVSTQMPLLSVRQFKSVVTSQRWPFEGPINDLGALLSAATGRSWPRKADEPVSPSPGDRPTTVDLQAPCSLQLRARAIFGVSSRAEIVRVLLLSDRPLTVSELADRVSFTRRQVGADSEALATAGFLKRSHSPRPMRVSLAHREYVEGILGPIGEDVDWAPMFRLLTGLRQLVHDLATQEWAEPSVEISRQLRALQPQMKRLELYVSTPGGLDAAGVVRAATDLVDRVLPG